MALSSTIYQIEAGDVGKTTYDLIYEGAVENPPGYLAKSHIYMWINDVQVTVGGGGSEYGGSGITFSFITSTSVSVSGYAAVLDDKVEFRRTMPIDAPVVDFVNGAGITEGQLDKLALSVLYAAHENKDGYGTGTQNYYTLAKLYATAAEDYEVETGTYSALHWAAKAAADAVLTAADAVSTAADVVSTNADAASTAADALSTAADAVATAADRVQTGLDAAATAADLVLTDADQQSCAANAALTAADVLSTAADAASTAADAAATAQDAIDTAADVVSTNADAASTAADAIATAADAVSTAADVVLANKWAEEDFGVEVETDAFSAKHWARIANNYVAPTTHDVSFHTATSGQTVFTHTSFIYNQMVWLDGVPVNPTAYSIAGTVLTLASGATTGQQLVIQTHGAGSYLGPAHNEFANGSFYIWDSTSYLANWTNVFDYTARAHNDERLIRPGWQLLYEGTGTQSSSKNNITYLSTGDHPAPDLYHAATLYPTSQKTYLYQTPRFARNSEAPSNCDIDVTLGYWVRMNGGTLSDYTFKIYLQQWGFNNTGFTTTYYDESSSFTVNDDGEWHHIIATFHTKTFAEMTGDSGVTNIKPYLLLPQYTDTAGVDVTGATCTRTAGFVPCYVGSNALQIQEEMADTYFKTSRVTFRAITGSIQYPGFNCPVPHKPMQGGQYRTAFNDYTGSFAKDQLYDFTASVARSVTGLQWYPDTNLRYITTAALTNNNLIGGQLAWATMDADAINELTS